MLRDLEALLAFSELLTASSRWLHLYRYATSHSLPPSELHVIAWSIITIVHWFLGHCLWCTESFSTWPTDAAKLQLLPWATALASESQLLKHLDSSALCLHSSLHSSFLWQNPNFMFTESLKTWTSISLTNQQLSNSPNFLVLSVLDRSSILCHLAMSWRVRLPQFEVHFYYLVVNKFLIFQVLYFFDLEIIMVVPISWSSQVIMKLEIIYVNCWEDYLAHKCSMNVYCYYN